MQRLTRNAVVAIAAVVVLAGCWAQPGSDSERTGFSPLDQGITPANVARLHVTWTKQLTTAVHDPAVTNAGVYVTSGEYPSAGTVAMLSRPNGATEWSRPLFAADSGSNAGPPTILGGKVYVPTPGISPVVSSAIRAFDAASGTEGPAIAEKTDEVIGRGGLLVGTGTQGGGGGPVATYLFVEDTNGSATWSTLLDAGSTGETLPAVTSPAVTSDHLIIGQGAAVQAWPLSTPGNCQVTSDVTFCPPAWSTAVPAGFPAGGHPVLAPDDSTVYAATGTSLVALTAATGTKAWSGTLGAAASAAPAVGDGFIYVPTTSGELDVFALGGCGHATCAPQWHTTTTSSISQAPAVVPGGLVYTGSANGNLNAFPAAGCGKAACASLWSAATGSTITGGPVPALGNLYVGTTDGRLIAYTL